METCHLPWGGESIDPFLMLLTVLMIDHEAFSVFFSVVHV
jgi:hypothetical protein